MIADRVIADRVIGLIAADRVIGVIGQQEDALGSFDRMVCIVHCQSGMEFVIRQCNIDLCARISLVLVIGCDRSSDRL